MNILISVVSQIPIYEQIKNQIREQVLSGVLMPDTQLPSIRAMARELKVGVITTKRAYEDLCEEGILVSQPGKGVFVARLDHDCIRRKHLELIKEQLSDIKSYADSVNIGKEDIDRILSELYSQQDT
ncbi:MAG: GntR family transcriptional regulator [Clostridiaceae bacterium]|jgi:GntR family transcriptional regulator|nr:GntR family transcriptional regulator [Clostridiaceae bacterium]